MSGASTQSEGAALSPVGCLALLWPGCDPALVDPAARQRIEQVVTGFAPVPRIALELRLADGDRRIDLHQRITQAHGERALLAAHLADASDDPLRNFLIDWAEDADGLAGAIEQIFLEWDVADAPRKSSTPAVFLPVDLRRDAASARGLRRALACDLIDRIQPGGTGRRAVEALCDTLPLGGSISHVGAMSGRAAGVRINLRAIRRGTLGAVLEAIGWPGEIAPAVAWFDRLVAASDRVTVALDLDPALLPRIGFEVFLDAPPEQEPRWALLLDMLLDAGLCAPDKRAALLAVSRTLLPEAQGQVWPAQWLLAAVASAPTMLPWFEAQLSHVKLTLGPQGSAQAKAYISAQHHWSRKSAPLAPAEPPRSRGEAIEAAVGFLLAARRQDDLWDDFRLVNGSSDEWVSAFVGLALARLERPALAAVLDQTRRAIEARWRPGSGWSYNAVSPADADSTAWALKFLNAVAPQSGCIDGARAFLASHRLADGGIATYAPSTPIRIGAVAVAAPGWRGSHDCVAANAAPLLDGALDGYLRERQQPEGCWHAMWWKTEAFATALALDSFGADAAVTQRAIGWARAQGLSTASPFDRAWLAAIMMRGDKDDCASAAAMLDLLAAEQRDDGSWVAGAPMLFPAPDSAGRDPGGAVLLDIRRSFTTAAVLTVMNQAAQRDRGGA